MSRRRGRHTLAKLRGELSTARSQISLLTHERKRATRAANLMHEILGELETRLRRALGEETALTVTPSRRMVSVLSGSYPEYLPIRTPLEDEDLSAEVVPDEVTIRRERLLKLVATVVAQPERFSRLFRFVEVTSGHSAQIVVSESTLETMGLGEELRDLAESLLVQLAEFYYQRRRSAR